MKLSTLQNVDSDGLRWYQALITFPPAASASSESGESAESSGSSTPSGSYFGRRPAGTVRAAVGFQQRQRKQFNERKHWRSGIMKRSLFQRRGSVLILVLILVPILALGAYAFNHAMRAETTGAQAATLQAQARWFAEAGIEHARSLLSDKAIFAQANAVDLFNNPGEFAAQPVAEAVGGTPAGMFSLVAADEKKEGSIRYGIESECAKIPLGGGKTQLRKEALMALPNMTEEIADSIIDYIDSDDEQQPNGAESTYYSSLNPPRQARNGPPLCIDELLLVKGVTPALLYGNDANMDGVAQPNETDGTETWPNDPGDGALNRGWYRFFTLHSVADNTKADATQKTNINGDQKTVAEALTQGVFDEHRRILRRLPH